MRGRQEWDRSSPGPCEKEPDGWNLLAELQGPPAPWSHLVWPVRSGRLPQRSIPCFPLCISRSRLAGHRCPHPQVPSCVLLTCRSTSRSTPPLPRGSGCGSVSADFLYFQPAGRDRGVEFKPGLVLGPRAAHEPRGLSPCYKRRVIKGDPCCCPALAPPRTRPLEDLGSSTSVMSLRHKCIYSRLRGVALYL